MMTSGKIKLHQKVFILAPSCDEIISNMAASVRHVRQILMQGFRVKSMYLLDFNREWVIQHHITTFITVFVHECDLLNSIIFA